MGEKMSLEKAAEFMRLVDNGQISGRISEWVGLREACGVIHRHLTQPAQAVDVGAIERSDVWVVQDEAGHPIHCAGWPQACREHIREAINEHGIEEARAWKVLHYTNGATA